MTNLFRNNSPGALTLEQARALEIKRHQERRRQAQELAAQGRGSDTEIAPVTPGELVVPAALQSLELVAVLRHAAAQQGIPFERLRVGSDQNRINPNTGAPEFAYGSPAIRDELRYPYRPDERQVADVFVSRDPNAAHGFGHVGIGVNTPNTQGFYPMESNMSLPIGNEVPGVLRNDNLNGPHDTLRIPTTPEQDAAVQAYIDQRRKNPGNYQLYDRQCTDFVAGGLRAANIPVPSDSTSIK